MRLGFTDRPIGFPAEIVPKPFVACLPFLLRPLSKYFLSPTVLDLAGRSVLDPFVIPPVIAKLEAQPEPKGDREPARAAAERSQRACGIRPGPSHTSVCVRAVGFRPAAPTMPTDAQGVNRKSEFSLKAFVR